MGKVYDAISESLADFIASQRMFFVATAPLSGDGHVNLSPKGLETFAVLDPRTVAYLDLTGSGIETLAHLRENGRVGILFCAFEGPPKIVRLHGRGTVLRPDHPDFAELRARFPSHPGTRSIIRVDLTRISDSCGFGVPSYEFKGQRSQLLGWAKRREAGGGLEAYQREMNAHSIDGLPGI